MNYNFRLNQDVEGNLTAAKPINGIANPTQAPVLSLVANANATLQPTTYYVSYSLVNSFGETLVSPQASLAVTSGNQLQVSIPSLPANATANVYISEDPTELVLQGSTATTTYIQSAAIVHGAFPATANTTAEWIIPVSDGAFKASLLPSTAITASSNTGNTDVSDYSNAVFYLNVSAASGTSPTLNVNVQAFDATSGQWFTVSSFTQATAATSQRLVVNNMFDATIRLQYVLGGTTPSFTFSVGAVFMP